MPLRIVRNDIIKMNTEAIVNTANAHATVGSGCDNAVYTAAGYEQLLQYRKEKIGFVPEGHVFLTPGFRLQAKYIIHAVEPIYLGGEYGEEEKLRSCYRESLQIAKEHHIKSISFPLISTGNFGYSKEEGMRIAVDEIRRFLLKNSMEIYLVVSGSPMATFGEKRYPGLKEYIEQHYVRAFSATSEKIRDVKTRDFVTSPQAYDFKKSKQEIKFLQQKKMTTCMHTFSFEEQHENKLEERMEHLSDTFSQYLMYLIREKKMENTEVYKRAIVDKKIFSKIKNNVNYHPQKITALCLCIGAKLNLDETKDLLARAGYALSPCDKTDIIFSYFIENEIYDMIELDIQLEEHGLPCIIS